MATSPCYYNRTEHPSYVLKRLFSKGLENLSWGENPCYLSSHPPFSLSHGVCPPRRMAISCADWKKSTNWWEAPSLWIHSTSPTCSCTDHKIYAGLQPSIQKNSAVVSHLLGAPFTAKSPRIMWGHGYLLISNMALRYKYFVIKPSWNQL